MSRRKLNTNRLKMIRLFANGQISKKEFQEKLKLEETTAGNYEMVISRFKKYGTRPKDKAICKEFFVWADEWDKEHRMGEVQNVQKEQDRRIRYKIELTVWEYT